MAGDPEPRKATTRPCEECRAILHFLKSPNGKPMPVQPVRTLYRLKGDRLEKIEVKGPVYVSHFETCPNPGRFSGGRERADPPEAR